MTTQSLGPPDETRRIGDTESIASPAMTGAGAKTTTTAKETAATGSSVRRRAWRGLSPATSRTRLPSALWALVLRLVVLMADYMLAFVTATVVIPMFAAWLHQQSGAASGKLTIVGTIAMWLTPLVFLVAILAAGEIAVMRALWRWATRTIQKTRDRRPAEPDDSVPPASSHTPPSPTDRQSKKAKQNRGR